MNSEKRVAIYLRVSTDGNKNGHQQDTGMQKTDIQAYLGSKGVFEFEVYEDKGFSGTKKDRPALKKLMQDCRNGQISMVVCWKMDRLFRSLSDLMNTLAEFSNLKVEFVALKDGIDLSSSTGRLMMQILGAFSEFEASVIKERVNAGIANARSKGVKLGRPLKEGHSVVTKMRRKGKSVSEIVEHTGLSKRSVHRTLKKEINNE